MIYTTLTQLYTHINNLTYPACCISAQFKSMVQSLLFIRTMEPLRLISLGRPPALSMFQGLNSSSLISWPCLRFQRMPSQPSISSISLEELLSLALEKPVAHLLMKIKESNSPSSLLLTYPSPLNRYLMA